MLATSFSTISCKILNFIFSFDLKSISVVLIKKLGLMVLKIKSKWKNLSLELKAEINPTPVNKQ